MPEGLPSIAEHVAASLPAVIASNPAPQPQPVQPQPSKTDATTTSTQSTSTETRKSLSESVPEPQEIKQEVIPPEHEGDEFKRLDGENDSKFIKRMKETTAQLRKELEAVKKAPKTEVNQDEIKSLREQLQERERTLEQTAYEKSEKFKDAHAKPIERAEKSARDLISKFTETKGVYERAMALDGRERLEFLREHAEDGASSIFDRLQRINELQGDRDDALKNFGEQAKEQIKETQRQQMEVLSKDFGSTFDKLSKSLNISGDKADSIKQEAFGLLDNSASPEDVLAASVLAVHYVREGLPKMAAMEKELATLRARVAEKQGDGAKINGRGADTNGSASASNFGSDGKPLPLDKILERSIAEVVARHRG